MHWIESVGQVRDLEGILRQRPELLDRYAHFLEGVWTEAGIPERVLHLVAQRIAAIHGLPVPPSLCIPPTGEPSFSERAQLVAGSFDAFSDAERAALAVAELLPVAHQQIRDDDIARLSEAYGYRGCVALLIAAAFFDVNCRLQIVWAA